MARRSISLSARWIAMTGGLVIATVLAVLMLDHYFVDSPVLVGCLALLLMLPATVWT